MRHWLRQLRLTLKQLSPRYRVLLAFLAASLLAAAVIAFFRGVANGTFG